MRQLGMTAILDAIRHEIDQIDLLVIHAYRERRTKEEMRKDILEMSKRVSRLRQLTGYGYEEEER